MIEVKKYINGFTIKGHSTEIICSVISYSTWALREDIHSCDNTARSHASIDDGDLCEGLTWLECDGRNLESMNLLERWFSNIESWCSQLYGSEVKVSEHIKNIDILKSFD